MKKTVFISDFDGTITKTDFFQMVTERLLSPEDLGPWNDYLAGRIKHIEALSRIFAKIRLSEQQMDAFAASIEVEPSFYKTLDLCKSLDIPVYICSAGVDFYIKKRIGKELEKYNITLLANSGQYSAAEGLKVMPPEESHPFYDDDAGVSKAGLTKSLKDQGFYVIYAGDGKPDFDSAKLADAVFAKSALLELCKKAGIKTLKFDSFDDISLFIKERYGIK